ncbi:MAG: extracellular solute-binding protein [Clostridia bacterium]|nr:extracellular solute-binding protein [Clostridia bacterium]
MKRFSKFYIGLILFLLFAPILVMIFFSFNEGKSTAVFTGFSLRWYVELFKNGEILNALKNSLILAVCSSIIATVLGTAAALGIHHMKNKYVRQPLMTVTNIPIMNPEIITGISMMFLFVFVGGMLGLTTKLNFWTMLIAHVTFSLPYVILNVLPKFKQMPKALPEAAMDLGCTPLQSFFKVQLPAIMPGVVTGLIMSFTLSLDDFVISYFTSGTDFQTLPILIYSMTKKSVKPTIYALSTIVFVLILVLLLISNRERSTYERLEAKKIKAEKKRKDAIKQAKKSKQVSETDKIKKVRTSTNRGLPSHIKSAIALVCALAIIITFCVVLSVFSEKTVVLNVYNWGEYISDGSEGSLDVNTAFEDYYYQTYGTRVKVNYVTYTSNEDLYAKLSTGAVSYDIIVPSDYMIARLASEGLLQKLDFENIPNYEECITDDFRGLYYDPNNEYSVPYTYGMVGVIYDANVVDEEDTGDWDLLWNPKYSGNILQFNNARDAFGTSFYRLGLNVNTTDKQAWNSGLEELQKQKPLLKKLVMDEIFNMMESGEASIASYYAGDYLTMVDNQAANVDLQFYYPENTNLFVDEMCIPTCAQNKELAEEYINFMLSEEPAIANAEYICYASPNSLVYNNETYKEDMGEDAIEVLYPENFDFSEKYDSNCYKDLDTETKEYLNSLWEKFKTGVATDEEEQEEQPIWPALIVFVAAIVVVTVMIIVIQKKKIKRSKIS